VALNYGPRLLQMALLGFAAGAAALLAEPPNSFLKRQMAIAPGAQGSVAPPSTCYVLLRAWPVPAVVAAPTLGRVIGSVVCVILGHQIVTLLGYWLGVRATAR
jgi:hypothetical protein